MRSCVVESTPTAPVLLSRKRALDHLNHRMDHGDVGITRTSRVLDWLSVALAMTGLAMMLSARAAYASWPLLGLCLPTMRLALSGPYRSRLHDARRDGWHAIRAFSRGCAPVPWL